MLGFDFATISTSIIKIGAFYEYGTLTNGLRPRECVM